MSDISCDVLVIGGGPGGYVCAIRAAQLGLKTVLSEENALGGTCLNVGCIPSKALIHVADELHRMLEVAAGSATGLRCEAPTVDLAQTREWKDGIVARLTGGVGALLKRAGVTVLNARTHILDGKTAQVEIDGELRRINAKSIVLATGSKPVDLPSLPLGGPVIGSTEALDLTEVPKRLVVVGAGYIGLELGTAFTKLGSKVEIIEAGDRVLPLYDQTLVAPVAKRLEELGISVRTGTRVEGVDDAGRVSLSSGETLECDRVLVTIGRTARTDGFGLETLDLGMNGPFVKIDDRCETSMRGVYAIGDVTGEPLLAHRAMAQGEMVAEILAGETRRWDERTVPAVCFTDPEIVTVGLSPDEAAARGVALLSDLFPFRANGRAMTLEREDGFIRVVAREEDHALIGVQAVGVGVAELAAAFSVALEMGARLEDIGAIIEAHPTLAEGFQEAALKVLGHAIHI